MSYKSSLISFFAMMAASSTSYSGPHITTTKHITPAYTLELERERKAKALDLKMRNGLKKWNIDGVTVYARNEKNALRKVLNIKANA